jgi:hypothetical protein
MMINQREEIVNSSDSEDDEHPQVIGVEEDVPLLNDLEHYLQRHGLQNQASEANYVSLNEREDRIRLEEAEKYQQQMTDEFLKQDDKDPNANILKREQILKYCEGQVVTFRTQDEVFNAPLLVLARSSDVFFTMARSKYWKPFNTNKQNLRGSKRKSIEGEVEKITFSLEEFTSPAVSSFLFVLSSSSPHAVEDISSHCIIECCRIAHYLQCREILDGIVNVISSSLDAENCTSILILADQLELTSLSEASMRFVLERLDDLQENEFWNDVPKALKIHVVTLRNAAMSSLIARSHSKKAFFSSSKEFLAIFSDNIQEHRERLREAKLRQCEIIKERERINASRGRFRMAIDVMGGDVRDARTKIEKQERRIKTLETFYSEQKAIFSKDESGHGCYLGEFTI